MVEPVGAAEVGCCLMDGYWIVEHFDGDEVIGVWTTEQPGVTGPVGLEAMLVDLMWQGRNVRWVQPRLGVA